VVRTVRSAAGRAGHRGRVLRAVARDDGTGAIAASTWLTWRSARQTRRS